MSSNRQVATPAPRVDHATHIRLDPNAYQDGLGRFTICGSPTCSIDQVLGMDDYSAANAFVKGQFTVDGDLCAAIRFFRQHEPGFLHQWWFSLAARWTQFADSIRHSRDANTGNIRFHYDRSNAFYRLFLDSRMLYSAAHFDQPEDSLDDAQVSKLDRICRSLDVNPEERFLDVGCGWGGLVIHAAERFGASCTGCTLSQDQLEFARAAVRDHGMDRRVTIEQRDYRDLKGRFDKIASVGMFEHVGRRQLSGYFQKIHSLLNDGGLFLNRGIVRPEVVSVGPATFFLQKSVFPGGGLVHLSEVVQEAEKAGFEVLDMEDLRRDYGLTCRAWVARLIESAENCKRLVGDVTYRTWLLYLAASAVSFEDGETDAVQLTFEKRPTETSTL